MRQFLAAIVLVIAMVALVVVVRNHLIDSPQEPVAASPPIQENAPEPPPAIQASQPAGETSPPSETAPKPKSSTWKDTPEKYIKRVEFKAENTASLDIKRELYLEIFALQRQEGNREEADAALLRAAEIAEKRPEGEIDMHTQRPSQYTGKEGGAYTVLREAQLEIVKKDFANARRHLGMVIGKYSTISPIAARQAQAHLDFLNEAEGKAKAEAPPGAKAPAIQAPAKAEATAPKTATSRNCGDQEGCRQTMLVNATAQANTVIFTGAKANVTYTITASGTWAQDPDASFNTGPEGLATFGNIDSGPFAGMRFGSFAVKAPGSSQWVKIGANGTITPTADGDILGSFADGIGAFGDNNGYMFVTTVAEGCEEEPTSPGEAPTASLVVNPEISDFNDFFAFNGSESVDNDEFGAQICLYTLRISNLTRPLEKDIVFESDFSPNFITSFPRGAEYLATLRVVDNEGDTATVSKRFDVVEVQFDPPSLTIELNKQGTTHAMIIPSSGFDQGVTYNATAQILSPLSQNATSPAEDLTFTGTAIGSASVVAVYGPRQSEVGRLNVTISQAQTTHPPTAVLSSSSSLICAGSSILLDGSASFDNDTLGDPQEIRKYTWTFSNLTTPGAEPPSATTTSSNLDQIFSVPGEYIVTLVVEDNDLTNGIGQTSDPNGSRASAAITVVSVAFNPNTLTLKTGENGSSAVTVVPASAFSLISFGTTTNTISITTKPDSNGASIQILAQSPGNARVEATLESEQGSQICAFLPVQVNAIIRTVAFVPTPLDICIPLVKTEAGEELRSTSVEVKVTASPEDEQITLSVEEAIDVIDLVPGPTASGSGAFVITVLGKLEGNAQIVAKTATGEEIGRLAVTVHAVSLKLRGLQLICRLRKPRANLARMGIELLEPDTLVLDNPNKEDWVIGNPNQQQVAIINAFGTGTDIGGGFSSISNLDPSKSITGDQANPTVEGVSVIGLADGKFTISVAYRIRKRETGEIVCAGNLVQNCVAYSPFVTPGAVPEPGKTFLADPRDPPVQLKLNGSPSFDQESYPGITLESFEWSADPPHPKTFAYDPPTKKVVVGDRIVKVIPISPTEPNKTESAIATLAVTGRNLDGALLDIRCQAPSVPITVGFCKISFSQDPVVACAGQKVLSIDGVVSPVRDDWEIVISGPADQLFTPVLDPQTGKFSLVLKQLPHGINLKSVGVSLSGGAGNLPISVTYRDKSNPDRSCDGNVSVKLKPADRVVISKTKVSACECDDKFPLTAKLFCGELELADAVPSWTISKEIGFGLSNSVSNSGIVTIGALSSGRDIGFFDVLATYSATLPNNVYYCIDDVGPDICSVTVHAIDIEITTEAHGCIPIPLTATVTCEGEPVESPVSWIIDGLPTTRTELKEVGKHSVVAEVRCKPGVVRRSAPKTVIANACWIARRGFSKKTLSFGQASASVAIGRLVFENTGTGEQANYAFIGFNSSISLSATDFLDTGVIGDLTSLYDDALKNANLSQPEHVAHSEKVSNPEVFLGSWSADEESTMIKNEYSITFETQAGILDFVPSVGQGKGALYVFKDVFNDPSVLDAIIEWVAKIGKK